jgi:hypothetical protein
VPTKSCPPCPPSCPAMAPRATAEALRDGGRLRRQTQIGSKDGSFLQKLTKATKKRKDGNMMRRVAGEPPQTGVPAQFVPAPIAQTAPRNICANLRHPWIKPPPPSGSDFGFLDPLPEAAERLLPADSPSREPLTPPGTWHHLPARSRLPPCIGSCPQMWRFGANSCFEPLQTAIRFHWLQ